MKKTGTLLILFALSIRVICYLSINTLEADSVERAGRFAFVITTIGILFILLDGFPKSKGVPKMDNPPAPPKKKKNSCLDGGSSFKI